MPIENIIWIAKQEQMPNIGQSVFVIVTKNGKAYNPYVAKYMGEGLFYSGSMFLLDKFFGLARINSRSITHWCRIPNAPLDTHFLYLKN